MKLHDLQTNDTNKCFYFVILCNWHHGDDSPWSFDLLWIRWFDCDDDGVWFYLMMMIIIIDIDADWLHFWSIVMTYLEWLWFDWENDAAGW